MPLCVDAAHPVRLPACLASFLLLTPPVQWFADGVVAVIAGIVAEGLNATWGPFAVFRASATALALTFTAILTLWSENVMPAHTPTASNPPPASNVGSALGFAFTDPRILLLAMCQCLFEGAMYTFVLVWVPTLRIGAPTSSLPFGLIFSCFMVCIMIGSALFSVLTATKALSVSSALVGVMVLASAAFGAVGAYPNTTVIVAAGFLAFEFCCGLYFPW